MQYQQYTIKEFKGLNEIDPPEKIGIDTATDLRNVEWDRSTGVLQRRGGYSALLGSSESESFNSIAVVQRNKIIGVRDTNVEAYTSAGVSIATQARTGAGPAASIAQVGTPNNSWVYVSDFTDYPDRFDGSAWSSRTNPPKAAYLAVQTPDNRLVGATTASGGGPGGASSSHSHVWFSDPGDPETWPSTNKIQLTPGDGEEIQGMVNWNNNLFVFKRSTLFIFYGNSLDSAGNPVFNYRTVSLAGAEMLDQTAVVHGNSVAVAPEGVYYVGYDGIYVTTGDTPSLVSSRLNPNFAFAEGHLSYVERRLYFRQPGSDLLYVFDSDVGEWTRWEIPKMRSNIIPHPASTDPDDWGLFGGDADSSVHRIFTLDHSDDDYNGAHIDAYWTSGFSNFGYESEKRLRYIDIWGTGIATLSVATDFGSPADAQGLSFGSSITKLRYATAHSGTFFGVKFANVLGSAFTIRRLIFHYEPEKAAEAKR